MSVVINILLLLLVIGVLTLVHELGHFIAAKIVGAKVFEFSLGFGPLLLSKNYKGTKYSIRILPFGGYVKILGDGDPSEEEFKKGDKKGDLSRKPKYQQIFVMLAGVTMNIILAIFIYYIVLGFSGWKLELSQEMENFKPVGAEIYREREKDVEYVELIEGGEASKSGLPSKAVIKSIDGVEVEYSDDVGKILREKKNEDITMLLCVDAVCSNYTVRVSENGKIGILLSSNYSVILSYEKYKAFAGFSHIKNSLTLIGSKLSEIINNARSTGDYTELSNSVSGPVGIYFVIDYIKKFGVIPFLSIIADLSVSLAIINVLPIPALDGGRVLILLIEGIFRRDLNEKVEAAIINISFILLIILILFIMVKDIINIDNIKSMFS